MVHLILFTRHEAQPPELTLSWVNLQIYIHVSQSDMTLYHPAGVNWQVYTHVMLVDQFMHNLNHIIYRISFSGKMTYPQILRL